MLLLLTLAAGCARPPSQIPTVPDGGTRIYSAEVLGPDGAPMFRYTRDSRVDGPQRTSIHRSYDASTRTLVVEQAAEHDAAYTLHRYVENHLQLGARSVVTAPAPGRLDYTTSEGGRTHHRSERIDAPAVTGPTLFGFVRTHWDQLERGEAIEIRFVVAEKRRSVPFVLRMSAPSRGRAVVEMRPRSALLRLALAPMRLLFDSETRAVLQYEGRIPPRRNGRPVDARVVYRHESDFR